MKFMKILGIYMTGAMIKKTEIYVMETLMALSLNVEKVVQ